MQALCARGYETTMHAHILMKPSLRLDTNRKCNSLLYVAAPTPHVAVQAHTQVQAAEEVQTKELARL